MRSAVTPTTTPALPSSPTPTMATMPEPICALPSSARLLRSRMSMPVTARARSFTPPTSRTRVAVARRAAAHGELLAGVDELALELAALLDQRREALGGVRRRRLEQAGELLETAALLHEVQPRRLPPTCASMPTDTGRDGALADDADEADVARARHVGAAAQLDRVSRAGIVAAIIDAHGDDADLVAVLLAEQRAGAGRDRLVDAHQPRDHGAVLADDAVDDGLDRATAPRRQIGLGWEKSKRSRSGATSEPFCATWSPSTWRSASCSRCVAEWLARIAPRRSSSTTSSSAIADRELAGSPPSRHGRRRRRASSGCH